MARLAALISAYSLVQGAACWGNLGHGAVGYLAEKYMSPEANSFISSFLDQNDDYFDAAVWPDKVKRERPYTREWHYIDAMDSPPHSCKVSYPSDCINSEHKDGCIISAIDNQTAVFLDANADTVSRGEALKYIFHFVGDLHQPLHVENAYRGGNDISVCWHRACARKGLHGVWDSDIPRKIVGLNGHPDMDEERASAQTWAQSLFDAQSATIGAQCANVQRPSQCTLRWATEVNKYICSFVLNQGGASSVEDVVAWYDHRDLSTSYFEGAVPIVEKLVGLAGARLGAYLDALAAAANGASRPSPSDESFEL